MTTNPEEESIASFLLEISNEFDLDPSTLRLSMDLKRDLNMDSLSIYELADLIVALSGEQHTEPMDFPAMVTLQDAYDYLREICPSAVNESLK